MIVNSKIKSIISSLISTHLIRGVQPSEVAEAIFEPNYKSLEVVNENNIVQMSVTFLDADDMAGSIGVTMRYTYNLDKNLMRIEQKVGGRSFKIQWDRENAINSLVDELRTQLSKLNNEAVVQRALDTIPEEVRCSISERLKLVV